MKRLGVVGAGLIDKKLRLAGLVVTAGPVMLFFLASCDDVNTKRQSAATAWERVETVYFHQGFATGPVVTTNSDGTLREERRYEPFGQPVNANVGGTVGAVDFRREPQNSLGKLTNPNTGWSYHGARWMQPQSARWTAPDPIVKAPTAEYLGEPWNLNPYSYASQSPTRFWDPTGLETLSADDIKSMRGGSENSWNGVSLLAAEVEATWATEEFIKKRNDFRDHWQGTGTEPGPGPLGVPLLINPITEMEKIDKFTLHRSGLLDDPILNAALLVGTGGGSAAARGGIRAGVEADLAVVNAQVGDSIVYRSAVALAVARGETMTTLAGLNALQAGERLSLVAHGTARSLGRMTSAELAKIINASGVRPAFIDLVSCNTGTGRFAQEVANATGAVVRAPMGPVNVLAGIRGVPQVRIAGQLAPPQLGFRTFLPVVR